MSDIRIVKHTSGMEVIGKVGPGSGDGKVHIEDAFIILSQQIRQNEFAMAITPVCIAAEDANKGLPVVFNSVDVVGVYPPNPGMKENYQRMTGAIITPPPPRVALKAVNHNKHP